jgi:ribose transport system substrate-binding protein
VKKKLWLPITLLLCLAVTACSAGGEKTVRSNEQTNNASAAPTKGAKGKKLKIGYTVMNLANPYFVDMSEGVKARCKELGYEVTIHDGKSDASQQISAIENFITQKMDVIVISPIDDQALIPVVKKAKEAGIIVIGANQKVEGEDAFITAPEYEYGQAIGKVAGQWIKDKLNGEAEVAILDFPELKPIIDRANGIKDAILSISPNAKVVANQSANTPEKGMRAMETILQAHPNVQVVVGVNDAGALGAYEAVMAAKKNSDKYFIGGLDAAKEALNKIAEKGIYRATIDIDPPGTGKIIVDTAVKVIENGPIKDTISVPMNPVTAENVDKYLKK